MTRAQRYGQIIRYFRENVPIAESELDFTSAFELLCAVILSAQCTDRRVNLITPELFKAFPTPESLASAPVQKVYDIIKSVSYPNAKAEHLVGMARKLVSDFGGEVPSDIDALMSMPGVGRKTANVVASIIYNKPVIAVDTHVFRVSHRLGLSKGKTPEAVEKDLERHVPPELRPVAHHWLILHGRYICTARSPKCAECPIREWCETYLTN